MNQEERENMERDCAQKTFVSWSKMALAEEGSNDPRVVDWVDQDLAAAS